MTNRKKRIDILMCAVILLGILDVITFPLAMGFSLASPHSPEHTLSYSTGKLTWDKDTSTYEDGTGKLTLFESFGDSFKSDNGDKIVAPGTEGENVIRLQNTTGYEISYHAVVYQIKSSELPVRTTVKVPENAKNSDNSRYIKQECSEILASVSGKIGRNNIADFVIDWQWIFEDKDNIVTGDELDTYLGNTAADGKAEDIEIGVMIVVEDEKGGGDVAPKTGDSSNIALYSILLIISGMALLLLLTEKRKDKKENTTL